MESSPTSRSGEIASDFFMILVTVVQLIFFTFFHKYIAWFTTEPDGSVTRLSMLTDDYFIWLPFVIAASIVAIVAHIIFIIYDNKLFRNIAEIVVYIMGISVCVSLLLIFPFDFSVIPNAAADIVPIILTIIVLLLMTIYVVTILVQLRKLKRYSVKKEPS